MIEQLLDLFAAWAQDTFFGSWLKRVLFTICMWLVAVGTLIGFGIMAWDLLVKMWEFLARLYSRLIEVFCRKKSK